MYKHVNFSAYMYKNVNFPAYFVPTTQCSVVHTHVEEMNT